MDKNTKKIEINDMIALCHIIDAYEEFEKKLIPMLDTRKYSKSFENKLSIISRGGFKTGAHKAKKFYKENKEIVDTINKHSNILMFITLNYCWDGTVDESFKFIKDYLLSHKEEIPQILALLEKLKELDFNNIFFNEKLDFTKEIYNVAPIYIHNCEITYVANPQVIPSTSSQISYKTPDSNYKMELEVIGTEYIYYTRKKIVLNSFIFDLNTLPEKIDTKQIFENLKEMKKEQVEKTSILRDTVELELNVSSVDRNLIRMEKLISRLTTIKNKDEFIKVLSNVKEGIEKLKILSQEHTDGISEQEPLLTPEVFEIEKTQYKSSNTEYNSTDLESTPMKRVRRK